MALSFPYSREFLGNCLVGPVIPLDLIRYDEFSGAGDGRHWAAQKATPLWGASYALYAQTAAHAREINGKVNGLDGSRRTFRWSDLYYPGPACGITAGLGGVTVGGIRTADRGAINLSGLPAGFRVTAGDYLSISYGSGRVYFGQFAETSGLVGGGGTSGQVEMRPYLPFGISVGASVSLVQPYFIAMIPPRGFTPFTNFRGRWGDSASITILQKP